MCGIHGLLHLDAQVVEAATLSAMGRVTRHREFLLHAGQAEPCPLPGRAPGGGIFDQGGDTSFAQHLVIRIEVTRRLRRRCR